MAAPSYSPLIRRMVRIGVAFAAVVVYGTVGYIVLEGWPFLDALYMTITTMTTVGFREVNELDTGGRVFTLTVVVLGVGTALIGISLLAAAIAEAELGGLTRRRRMAKRIEGLEEHFIVCAYGRVGRAAVRELQSAGVDVVVIDPKEELQERMERDGVPFMVDDPSLEPVLRRAKVEAARGSHDRGPSQRGGGRPRLDRRRGAEDREAVKAHRYDGRQVERADSRDPTVGWK